MKREHSTQLTFLSDDPTFKNSKECDSTSDFVLKIYIDGAARNNPGPSGAGICFMQAGEVVFEQGFFLGNRTNNQAEYFALLLAVFFAREYVKPHAKIIVYSDSQLLVRQMVGMYKVRDPFLKKMQAAAYDIIHAYQVTFCHIYREHNVRADALANKGIDNAIILPKKFVDLLAKYTISQ
ncbi:ribonuclease HI family protein [Candidatus Babeliales bacterium]|nr:ribonuclease HI family protein [Candidatus Babeliales bacterium]